MANFHTIYVSLRHWQDNYFRWPWPCQGNHPIGRIRRPFGVSRRVRAISVLPTLSLPESDPKPGKTMLGSCWEPKIDQLLPESAQKSRTAAQNLPKSTQEPSKSCPRAPWITFKTIQIDFPLIFVAKMHPWNRKSQCNFIGKISFLSLQPFSR